MRSGGRGVWELQLQETHNNTCHTYGIMSPHNKINYGNVMTSPLF